MFYFLYIIVNSTICFVCLIATAIQIHACDAFCYLLDDSSNLTSYVTLDYKNDLANLAFYFYIKLAWWLLLLSLMESP